MIFYKYSNKIGTSFIVSILPNCFQFQLSKVASSNRVNRYYESIGNHSANALSKDFLSKTCLVFILFITEALGNKNSQIPFTPRGNDGVLRL